MTTWHRPEVSTEEADMAVELLLDIVLSSEYCTASRMRWGDILRKFLRAQRKIISVIIPWRRLHEAVQTCSNAPAQAYTGLSC